MQNDLMLKKTGLSLRINGDPDNLLEFDPLDMLFAERYMALLNQFDKKIKEHADKFNEIEEREKSLDQDQVLVGEKIQVAKDACNFVREQIDFVFGEGTSKKLFGDTLSMSAYADFFEAITPHIKNARAEKVSKYQNTPNGKKRVMK